MTLTLFHWLMAFSPIFSLLFLLICCRWQTAQAAVVALAVAAAGGCFIFGGSISSIGIAFIKGVWNSLSVILVIISALLLYEVSQSADAFVSIKGGIERFLPDKTLQIIAIGWIFVDFLQGITGFGVPVVVCAPLLISIGVNPLKAVIITLMGQSWGTTFGTLGLAWSGLLSQINTDAAAINSAIIWSAGLLIILDLGTGFAITCLSDSKKAVRHNALLVIFLALFQGIGQSFIALYNPILCNFIIAAASLILLFIIARLPYYQKTLHNASSNSHAVLKNNSLFSAFLPYLVLTLIAVIVLLNNNIKNFLGQWQLSLCFPNTVTSFGYIAKGSAAYAPLAIFIHPAFFLFAAALFGCFYYTYKKYLTDPIPQISSNALQRALSPAFSIASLMAMSGIMNDTGQITLLAQGVASLAGSYYPLFAPFIGLLGTFMTASNLSSNILFGSFQAQIADIAPFSLAPLLAAQIIGSSLGTIISPSNILLGTTAAKISGKEGAVLSKLIPFILAGCALFGCIVYLGMN